MDRRQFIGGVAGAASAVALGSVGCEPQARAEQGQGSVQIQVIRARDSQSVATLQPDAARVRQMVDRSIVALTGATNAQVGWSSLFQPSDVVGLKTNCLAGRGLSSSVAVVDAIAAGLHDAGIPHNHIIV